MAVPESLTLRQILSVRCPVCRAKPGEKCKFSTGTSCPKPHQDRSLYAAKMSRSENLGQAALRVLSDAAGRTLDRLFPSR